MRSRRGFALFVALTLVALVGLATTLVMRSFTNDAQRTRAVGSDAQLSQLIIVGAIQAQEMLNRGPLPSSTTLELPGELNSNGAKVQVKFLSDGGSTTAEISASLGKAGRDTTLRFVRRGQHGSLD